MATIYYGLTRQAAANKNSTVTRSSGSSTGLSIELSFDDAVGITQKDLHLALVRLQKYLSEFRPSDARL